MHFTRIGRRLLGVAVLSAVTAVLATSTPAVAADGFVPGSPGLGDPFFPNAGNGGYDVSHYSLTLAYEPSSNRLSGTAAITATARRTSPGSTSTCAALRSHASKSTARRRRSRARAIRSL